MKNKLIMLIFTNLFILNGLLHAEIILNDYTSGHYAIKYNKSSRAWFEMNFSALDANTTTSPPDSMYHDRRIEGVFIAGSDLAFSGGNMGLRLNVKNITEKKKEEEAIEPKSPQNYHVILTHPSIDLTYINPKGLELFFGIKGILYSGEESVMESNVANTKTVYEPGDLFSYRFGLVKRGAGWAGGFYHVLGKDSTRNFVKTSSDNTEISGSSYLVIEPEYGIISEFTSEATLIKIDFATVQGSEGGERTSTGKGVNDDYLRAFLSASFPMGGEFGLTLGIAHRTLSYANNAYANLDSIPRSSLRLLADFGSSMSKVNLGVILGYGEDGADIKEYKARYSFQALSLVFGMTTNFQ